MNNELNHLKLKEALSLLNEQLVLLNSPKFELVVCGGSALIATGLVPRTTRDIDILALMEIEQMKSSEPLPEILCAAAKNVGEILGLESDWLNNGPASQFQLGLPEGFQEITSGKLRTF